MLKNKYSKILSLLLMVSFISVGCSDTTQSSTNSTNQIEIEQSVETQNKVEDTVTANEDIKSGNSKVHFIDTGNSDSILVENNGEFMLIDGGDTDDDSTVHNYLQKVGVKTIKYLVSTHPHADHLGAFDTVVNNYNIENVFVGYGSSNTKVYQSFINSVNAKGYKITTPKENTVYKLGDGIIKFYNTKGEKSSDLNNDSIITLYSNGEDDFLFTGDAETDVEMKYANLIGDIDVLKASHHGSKTGCSEELLDILQPESVLLLTGENSYGHPHKEVVDLLQKENLDVYRSDESGDIVATSTGNGITFNTEPDSYKSGSSTSTNNNSTSNTNTNNQVTQKPTTNNTSKTYYFTKSGKSYHTTKDCSTLSRSKNILEGSLDEAISQGKDDPCDKCN